MSALLRGAGRGAVGAMAMTGLRTAAAGLTRPGARSGDAAPPEAVLTQDGPGALQRLPEHQRRALAEVLHWGYGAAGGAAYGLLPARLRAARLAGPAYGLALWALFEVVLAPVLGVHHAQHAPRGWRAAVAADHVLYGLVVGGGVTPEHQRAGGPA